MSLDLRNSTSMTPFNRITLDDEDDGDDDDRNRDEPAPQEDEPDDTGE